MRAQTHIEDLHSLWYFVTAAQNRQGHRNKHSFCAGGRLCQGNVVVIHLSL
ncbi:hypothetical protein LEMLEM_LOCUS24629 [Lemmus lemmus]